jgi:large subunit ribosomal protein L28
VGTKITGKTKRKIKPNLQKLTVMVDGSMKRVMVSTKAIRMGLVVKPLKRKYVYKAKQEQAAAV